jgi:hypothetical protein
VEQSSPRAQILSEAGAFALNRGKAHGNRQIEIKSLRRPTFHLNLVAHSFFTHPNPALPLY